MTFTMFVLLCAQMELKIIGGVMIIIALIIVLLLLNLKKEKHKD